MNESHIYPTHIMISKTRHYENREGHFGELAFSLWARDLNNPENDKAVSAHFTIEKSYPAVGLSLRPRAVVSHEVVASFERPEHEPTCQHLGGKACRFNTRVMGLDYVEAYLSGGDDAVWDLLYGELDDLMPKEEPVAT